MKSQDIFLQLLDQHIADARIRVIVNGESFDAGKGGTNGECDVAVRVHNPRLFSRILSEGNLGMGESYMNHDFDIVEGELYDFLTILLRNRIGQKLRLSLKTVLKVIGVQIINSFRGNAVNNQAHYDVGDDLYEVMLDKTMTYTCGYARSPEDGIDQMQINKLDRICRKLRLQPGERLLDIGCGYGGLLIHAARNYGATGVGVTNSKRHFERGNQNIAEAEVSDKVKIEYKDFSEVSGRFDKLASVGVLEHLQPRYHRRYYRVIADALKPQGLGLIHTIGCNAARNVHDPFIQKYIFPGSNQSRLSEIASGLERNGLPILDVENMARHYALTARHWLRRFEQNKERFDSRRYDDRFKRMWEYYLHCCVAAATASEGALYQVLFTNDYAAPIPLQRV